VLSPGGRTIAFVRSTGGTVQGPYPDLPRTELRTVDARTGRERLLVCPRQSGGTVYFVSSAWVTSGAVHAATVATGRERYVCPGSLVEVVPWGPYRGDLVVEQHRYLLGGGSYDWAWLLTPGGKEVGPIRETGEQVDEFRRTFVDRAGAGRSGGRAGRKGLSAPAPASPGRR
jgi:hypothetical protein